MPENFVKIVSFGLIGDSQDGSKFRHVMFEDLSNGRSADYIVNEKQRPMLWTDIMQLELGKSIPPYKGYISQFNGIDIVVLGDETLEEAFAKQEWKFAIHKNISRKEADKMRKLSKGYCTNLTARGAMEIAWRPIENDAKMIRFRDYIGNGSFTWSKWFEVYDR